MEGHEIFTFLLAFGEILAKWTGALWDVLNTDITIFGETAKMWAILGVSGLALLFIANVIKNIVD